MTRGGRSEAAGEGAISGDGPRDDQGAVLWREAEAIGDADERRLAGSVGAFAAVCQGSGVADLILQAKTAAGDRKARHQRARDQPMTQTAGSERRDGDHGDASLKDAKLPGRGARQVDDARAGSGTIVNRYDNILAGTGEHDAHARADRQGGMGRGEGVLVIDGAAACQFALPSLAAVRMPCRSGRPGQGRWTQVLSVPVLSVPVLSVPALSQATGGASSSRNAIVWA